MTSSFDPPCISIHIVSLLGRSLAICWSWQEGNSILQLLVIVLSQGIQQQQHSWIRCYVTSWIRASVIQVPPWQSPIHCTDIDGTALERHCARSSDFPRAERQLFRFNRELALRIPIETCAQHTQCIYSSLVCDSVAALFLFCCQFFSKRPSFKRIAQHFFREFPPGI